MPDQTEVARGQLARRLITFYAILAVIGVAVVIFVVSKGGNEKAQPSIAGGYTLAAASPCIGPVPKPAGGLPLPSTAPTQVSASGPSFNVLQSGQFVNFTNNQNTLGGQLRLNAKALPGNRHRLTGTVDCVSGGRSLTSTRSRPRVPRPRSPGASADFRSRRTSRPDRRRRAPPRRGRRRTSRARTPCPRARPASAARSRSTAPAPSPSSTPRATSCSGRSPTRRRPPACSATSSASRAAPRD